MRSGKTQDETRDLSTTRTWYSFLSEQEVEDRHKPVISRGRSPLYYSPLTFFMSTGNHKSPLTKVLWRDYGFRRLRV